MALTLNPDQWLTLLVAVLGVLGTLAGAALQNRHDTTLRVEEREERMRAHADAETAQWRIEASPAIGATRELLVDINPLRVMMNIQLDRVKETYQELNDKWEEVRRDLARLGAHPSADVARLADETVAAIHRTLHWLG